MQRIKRLSCIILAIVISIGLFGCSDKTEEVESIIPSEKATSSYKRKAVKDEAEAKELVFNYLYINAIDYSIYDDQSGKVPKSVKKDGYYYFAVFKTENGKDYKCDRFLAVKKKDSTLYTVNEKGKTTSIFDDDIFGQSK